MKHQRDWLSLMLAIDDLEIGFNEYELPKSKELSGKKIELFLDNNEKIFINFQSDTNIVWNKEGEMSKNETYNASSIRPNIFFVDWVFQENNKKSMSLVLDFVNNEALILSYELPDKEKAVPNLLERIRKYNVLSAVDVDICHAGINQKREKKVHHRTTELIGKRLKHTYSSEHAFEHIYLNEYLFCWQSLAGPDKGLGDTEPCDYIKIADELYLFMWWERIIPWVGVVLVDLKQNRTSGKAFYHDLDAEKITNFTLGAHVKFLSDTKYD